MKTNQGTEKWVRCVDEVEKEMHMDGTKQQVMYQKKLLCLSNHFPGICMADRYDNPLISFYLNREGAKWKLHIGKQRFIEPLLT